MAICLDCDYDTHTCKGCGTPVAHVEGRVCEGCRDCKHEIMRSSCADCRGLKDPNPHEDLLIEQFHVNARFKARCACCPDKHQIQKGDLISRAVEDSDNGRPPFKDFGWVCTECSDLIAYGQHK